MRFTCRTRSRSRFARERCKRFASSSSGTWNAHDAARLTFASMPRHEHPNEAFGIGAIRLEPSPSPAHLDARGIEHAVANAARDQQAMEPEAIITSFVAAADLGRLPVLSDDRGSGPIEKPKQAINVTAVDLEQADLLDVG